MFLILSKTYTKLKLKTAQFHTVSVIRLCNYISITMTMGSINIFHTTTGVQYWKQANLYHNQCKYFWSTTNSTCIQDSSKHGTTGSHLGILTPDCIHFFLKSQTANLEIKRYFSRSLPSAVISFLAVKIQGYLHWNTVEIRKVYINKHEI